MAKLSKYVSEVKKTVPGFIADARTIGSGAGKVPSIPVLGGYFSGGKIFRILVSGDVGYVEGKTMVSIVSDQDAGDPVCWSYASQADGAFWRQQGIGTTLPGISESKSNTDKILAILTTNLNPAALNTYAAYAAFNYASPDGSTDKWSLPSSEELDKICWLNKYATSPIKGFLPNVSGEYWSSTETVGQTSQAVYLSLSTYGTMGDADKELTKKVLPVKTIEYTDMDYPLTEDAMDNLVTEEVNVVRTEQTLKFTLTKEPLNLFSTFLYIDNLGDGNPATFVPMHWGIFIYKVEGKNIYFNVAPGGMTFDHETSKVMITYVPKKNNIEA